MISGFTSVWAFLEPIQNNVIALGFSLLAAIIYYFFRPRVRLLFGRANNSRNVLFHSSNEGENTVSDTEVYVEKFFVQNTGRKLATDVEFVLSAPPNDVVVWPPTRVRFERLDKGEQLVFLPFIAPGELVIVDCLYLNQRASSVVSLRCAEVVGKEVGFHTLRKFPNWITIGSLVAMLLGIAFIFSVIGELL